MSKASLLTVMILGIFFTGILSRSVFAESAFGLPDPGLTPESPFYFLDLWDEDARLFFTYSDSSRVKRYEARIRERLSEAETLAGRGISATQRALELYREDIPFFYAAVERLSDDAIFAGALRMASDHLDTLDYISERTNVEKKRFILTAKLFIIEQQLQSLHVFAKHDIGEALDIYGDALRRRMARIREVAIDDQNNEEAFHEYAAYVSEAERVVRDWGVVKDHGISPAVFLAEIVGDHEETLLGPVRERIPFVLENELLSVVNSVRKLSRKEHVLSLPLVPSQNKATSSAATSTSSSDPSVLPLPATF